MAVAVLGNAVDVAALTFYLVFQIWGELFMVSIQISSGFWDPPLTKTLM